MMTQERIDYFLQLHIEKITDLELRELKRDYFREDKSDWYEIVEKENSKEKKWNDHKVNQFWKLFRVFLMPVESKYAIYNFMDFIFPPFISYEDKNGNLQFDYFWNENEKKEFSREVYFNRATFLGEVIFDEITFTESIFFDEAIFLKGARFNKSTFQENVSFTKSSLYNSVSFLGSSFNNQVVFDNAIFFGETFFHESVFLNELSFSNASFSGKIDFYKCDFLNKVNFSYANFIATCDFISVIFHKDVDFSYANFFKSLIFKLIDILEKGIFYSTNFKEELFFEFINTSLEDRSIIHPILSFYNIDFNNKVKFSRFNVSGLRFLNCNLVEANFNRCEWNDAIINNRLILKIESHFEDAENHYRQLKRNFSKKNNWEMAGYAYVSEMEMRKKTLWFYKKYLIWIFYAFYGTLGGYTQDFIKPLKALFGFFLFFSGIYLLIDGEYENAFQRSISATLPYLEVQNHIGFKSYWLIVKNIQFILSITLLSFFVLALRKRFKL